MLSLLLFSCGRSWDFSLTRESNSLSDYRRVRLLSLEPRVLLYFSQNFSFRYWDYDFSLENKDPAECTTDFRFEKLIAGGCVTDCGSKFFFFFGSCSERRMHDARMLDTSGLYVDLAKFAFSPAEQEMCIYGDLAYPLRTHLQCPFRHGVLTRQMEEFNASMSSVLQVKFLDYKKKPSKLALAM